MIIEDTQIKVKTLYLALNQFILDLITFYHKKLKKIIGKGYSWTLQEDYNPLYKNKDKTWYEKRINTVINKNHKTRI